MRKCIICIIALLMMVGTCFAALTNTEKKMIKEIYRYYSGEIINVPANETIRDTILEGTELQRRVVIKDYLKSVKIPTAQAQKTNLDAVLLRLGTEIIDMQDWIAAN